MVGSSPRLHLTPPLSGHPTGWHAGTAASLSGLFSLFKQPVTPVTRRKGRTVFLFIFSPGPRKPMGSERHVRTLLWKWTPRRGFGLADGRNSSKPKRVSFDILLFKPFWAATRLQEGLRKRTTFLLFMDLFGRSTSLGLPPMPSIGRPSG